MHIVHALSYGNAWSRLATEYETQFEEIKQVILSINPEVVAVAESISPLFNYESPLNNAFRLEGYWERSLIEKDWEPPPKNFVPTASSRPLSLRQLGLVKSGVSIGLIRHREILNRWLYTIAPMAARAGVVDIPVAVILTGQSQSAIYQRASGINSRLFETTRDELTALAPLSHASPFLILTLDLEERETEVVDLSKEEGVEFRQIVVNRSIEFPPQYHQAGLGVLTYFGTILREKYPNHDAKVRIEQDGLKVRLIIESENGDREIIEKALQEYEMVVLGERPPESLLADPAGVIDLKNELRIAHARIENQRDIISLQGDQITTLRQVIGNSLSRPEPSIVVNVQPVMRVENHNINTQSTTVSNSIQDISDELKEFLGLTADQSMHARILDLTEALDVAATREAPETVRDSAGLSKLSAFIKDATTVGTKANEVLSKIEDGLAIVQGLGQKYNAIAEWCGAPQIPKIFLGKNK